jgi:selenocysteine-specific elongation factor
LSALLDGTPGFTDLSVFARDRALRADDADDIAARLALTRIVLPTGVIVLAPATWLTFKRSLLAQLETYHADNPDLAGMGMERLRLMLTPRLPAPVFAAVLQWLARQKEIALDGAWVRLPGHEVRLTPQDEALWHRTKPLLGGDERFRPPRVRDIGGLLNESEVDVRRMFKLLGRLGRVDEVAHDHFFLRDTVAEMVEIVVDLAARAADGQFSAALFRDRLDNGRKVAIQILEFFDRHGVTLRRADLRRINRHRLDLFRRPTEDGATTMPEHTGREASLVGRPVFKTGKGREPVLGGFDSHSLPPLSRSAR